MSDDILDRARDVLAYELTSQPNLVRKLVDEIEHLRAERDQWKALWKDSVAEASAAIEERDRAVAASQPRRIETVEELDALPVGAVLRGHRGEVFELWVDMHGKPLWYMAGGVQRPTTFDLPALLLWSPEVGDER